MPAVALFGGSLNPPTVQHRAIVEALARQFDSVVIVPCGPRAEKRTNDGTDAGQGGMARAAH